MSAANVRIATTIEDSDCNEDSVTVDIAFGRVRLVCVEGRKTTSVLLDAGAAVELLAAVALAASEVVL